VEEIFSLIIWRLTSSMEDDMRQGVLQEEWIKLSNVLLAEG
jgi:hypothetical protein